MNVRFLGALLLGIAGCTGQAWAHGGVSIDQGQCVMKIGPDTMTFTGYQPQKSREQFCDDIPDVGPTIIVLDAQQDELRDMALKSAFCAMSARKTTARISRPTPRFMSLPRNTRRAL